MRLLVREEEDSIKVDWKNELERQMGHLSVWNLKSSAQALHRQRWLQGHTVMSRGSDMQMTHSLPLSVSPPAVASLPYRSCTKYTAPPYYIYSTIVNK